jgi:hypothetical protein
MQFQLLGLLRKVISVVLLTWRYIFRNIQISRIRGNLPIAIQRRARQKGSFTA